MTDKKNTKAKHIKTLQFGDLDIEAKYIFNFKDGLLGFEELSEFVLISEEETVPFRWLISIEQPAIGFPMLNPWLLDANYDPATKLDNNKDVLMVVVTLEDEKGLMTANLKAPIIFDIANLTGKQMILTSDKYSTNYVINK
jgi:flagellar assembly factor FliW